MLVGWKDLVLRSDVTAAAGLGIQLSIYGNVRPISISLLSAGELGVVPVQYLPTWRESDDG
jgi:hypothetical protein